MDKYLKRIIVVYIVPIIGFLYIIGVMYFYDPLQLFSEKYHRYYHENTRLSAKRVIDNYDFDSIIFGSSKVNGFSAKEFKNGVYINIATSNLDMFERYVMLNYILKHKKIKNVVSSLDGFWDSGANKKFLDLYANKNRFLVYFNGLIPYSCFVNYKRNHECIGIVHNYYDIKFDYSSYKNRSYKFNENDFNFTYGRNPAYIQYNLLSLNKYLIQLIKGYPDVNFYFFIPPHSTLSYKKYNVVEDVKILKQIISRLSQFENIKIYFFGNEKFVDNLNNYIDDKEHYYKWINSRIAKAINERTNIISIDNMDEEFDRFIKKVENYDIKAYEEALKLDIRE